MVPSKQGGRCQTAVESRGQCRAWPAVSMPFRHSTGFGQADTAAGLLRPFRLLTPLFSICHSAVGLIVCLPTGQITHGVTWRGAQGDTVPPKATLRAEASRTSASPSSGGCLASGWEHLLWSQTWFMYQLCCSTARSS